MKTVRAYKAQTMIRGAEPVESVSIVIDVPIPDVRGGELKPGEAFEQFRKDAEAIYGVLAEALPGGTLTRLYAIMAQKHAENVGLVLAEGKP